MKKLATILSLVICSLTVHASSPQVTVGTPEQSISTKSGHTIQLGEIGDALSKAYAGPLNAIELRNDILQTLRMRDLVNEHHMNGETLRFFFVRIQHDDGTLGSCRLSLTDSGARIRGHLSDCKGVARPLNGDVVPFPYDTRDLI